MAGRLTVYFYIPIRKGHAIQCKDEIIHSWRRGHHLFYTYEKGGGQLFCTTNFRGGGGPLLFWVYNFLSPRRKYIHLHTVFVRDWSKHIVRRGLKLLGGHQIYFSIHMGGDEKLTLMWLPHHIMLFFIFYIQHIIDGRGFFTISLFLNSKGGINITIDHLTKWLWPYPP